MPEQLKGLTWFKSRFAWLQVFNELSDSELRLLIESIWNYAEEGTEPADLPSTLRIVWVMIRAELTQDIADRQNVHSETPNSAASLYNGIPAAFAACLIS